MPYNQNQEQNQSQAVQRLNELYQTGVRNLTHEQRDEFKRLADEIYEAYRNPPVVNQDTNSPTP